MNPRWGISCATKNNDIVGLFDTPFGVFEVTNNNDIVDVLSSPNATKIVFEFSGVFDTPNTAITEMNEINIEIFDQRLQISPNENEILIDIFVLLSAPKAPSKTPESNSICVSIIV